MKVTHETALAPPLNDGFGVEAGVDIVEAVPRAETHHQVGGASQGLLGNVYMATL